MTMKIWIVQNILVIAWYDTAEELGKPGMSSHGMTTSRLQGLEVQPNIRGKEWQDTGGREYRMGLVRMEDAETV